VPLATVFGSQGDACKRLGALHGAALLYEASAACLERGVDGGHGIAGGREAAHALSVSLNKLGDVRYLMQVWDVVYVSMSVSGVWYYY
jgi:hypothetical protein